MLTDGGLDVIEQVARAAIATHPEQEGTDVFDNSDVLELCEALRVERATSKQLREALTALIAATEQQNRASGLIGAVLLARADAKRVLGDVSAKGAAQ